MSSDRIPAPRRPTQQHARCGAAAAGRRSRAVVDELARDRLTRRAPDPHRHARPRARREPVRLDPDLLRRVLAGLRGLP